MTWKNFLIFIEKKIMADKKWASSVHPKKNKMHDLLGIPEGEDIKNHYSSGEALAKALVAKVGKAEASHMLALPANANSSEDIYDSALHAVKKMDESLEESMRKYIRAILEANLDETDLMANSKKAWEDEKADLKKKISSLSKKIEKGGEKSDIEDIDSVIKDLQSWKSKINKNI